MNTREQLKPLLSHSTVYVDDGLVGAEMIREV